MPGIAEFVTLSQHSGDGEGVAQPPALGSPVSVAIVAAYIYNSALAIIALCGAWPCPRVCGETILGPFHSLRAVLLSSTWHLFILCIVSSPQSLESNPSAEPKKS